MAGKRTLILGLAREGVSLARYLSRQGARVIVTDSAAPETLSDRVQSIGDDRVQFALGRQDPDILRDVEILFTSPGIPESNPLYAAAMQTGIPIRSMTTLFFDLCPATIVGVTGSSGKTTTTGLIGRMLSEAGRHVVVGGNIGDPMLDLLPHVTPETIVVLELSSFQLSLLRTSPHISVVTNISPNHLDRHGTMKAYIAAKRQIVAHQNSGDYAVLNAFDPVVAEFSHSTSAQVRWFGMERVPAPGVTTRDEWIGVHDERFSPILPLKDIPLLGLHNVENVLAAATAADILEVPPDVIARAVRAYRPAPHRLEIVGEHKGVRYVDDSIATSPARLSVALQALDSPVLLIAGGRDKNLPWSDVARLIVAKVRCLLLIGEAADLIQQEIRREMTSRDGALTENGIYRCQSLPDAVEQAHALAVPGDTVLLSPGCTSYDMFRDYEERGAIFLHAVEAVHAA